MYKVKELAEIAGVSVRTLHHYDQMDVVKPDSITPTGYRLYGVNSLERLQHVLFFREMGFTLKQIKEMVEDRQFDQLEALYMHQQMLQKKRERLDKMLSTVSLSIHSLENGKELEVKTMFDGFDRSEIEQYQQKYAEEVRRKYPKEVVETSERRTSSYDKEDWKNIEGDMGAIYSAIANRMTHGVHDEQVQHQVEHWRHFITEHFYDCTLEIFRGLADLYVTDERFTKNINQYKEGLAPFLSKAIIVYCENEKADE
ncbi:MerR family transcriptional regulator [Pontibacillus litoralis]|uniref:MerR family transcriptional regulator n=1 Tax=Pontibacillus litoralis JSM 072002 TaxID=1385512 RepID=A0A0A5G217_9BACI|nr:MerR family transcriptional regulator [Pontibacillus litoralis]KGX85115.1 MerR family transcriptional regulator [Pontibacillus litoralis JSM 072002]